MDDTPARAAPAAPTVTAQSPAPAVAMPANGIASAAPVQTSTPTPATATLAPMPTPTSTPSLSFSIPTTALSAPAPMAAIQTMASLGLMPNGMPHVPLVPVKRKPGRPRKNPLPPHQMMAIAAMNPMALALNGVPQMPFLPQAQPQPRPQAPVVKRKPGRPKKVVAPPQPVNADDAVQENGTVAATSEAAAKRGSGRAKKVVKYADENDGSEEEKLMAVEKTKRSRQLDSDIRVDVGYPLLEQIVGRRMNERTGATEYLCKFLGRSYLHLYWLTFEELELFIPEGYSKYHRVQQYERKLRREGYQDLDDVDDVEANKVTIEKILSHKVDPTGHLDEQIEKRRKEVAVPKRFPRVTDRFLLDNTDALQERLTGIVRKLLNENGGEIFAQPVSADDVPEYLNIISNPMDLGSIATRLGRESYYVGPSAASLFAADVRLVFINCKSFNSDDSSIWQLADELLKTFEKWFYEWIMSPTAWLKLPPTGSIDDDRKLAKKFRAAGEASFDTWLPWQIGCCICHSNDESDQLLLCDRCDGEIHMFCSSPAITELPEGEWFCTFCQVRQTHEDEAKVQKDQHRREAATAQVDQAVETIAQQSPHFLWEPIEEVKKFNRNVAGKQDLLLKTASNSVKDRATFFLVKWVGMSIRYSTWERPQDIGDDEQIQRYFKASRMPTVKEISETTCQLPCCARRNQLMVHSVGQRCCEKDKYCTRGFQHKGDCSREIGSLDKAYGTPAFRHLRMVEQVKAQLFAFHCLLNNHTPDKEVLKQCGVYTNAYVCKKQYLHASLKQTHRVGDNEDEDYSEDEGSESEDDDYDDEVDEEDLPYRFRPPAPVSLYTDMVQGGTMDEGDGDDDDVVGKKKPEDEVSDVLGALVEHVALGYPTTLEKVVQTITYDSKYAVTSFQGVESFTEYSVALPRTSLGLGMRLGSDEDGASVVLGFQRLVNGMVGPAEASQVITTGDVLAAVNNVAVAKMSFKDVVALIAQSPEFIVFHFHSKRPAHTFPAYCQSTTVKTRCEPVFENAADHSDYIPYSYNNFKSPLRVGKGSVLTTTSLTIADANFLTPTGPMQHLYAGIVDNSIDPHEHFASFLPADRAGAKQTAKKSTADKNDFVPYEQSPTFKGGRTLRSYQVEGLNWMVTNWKQQRSCILADEMGLGKTVQVVSFIDHLRSEESIRGPFLIVVPLSTIQHWRREIESWTDLNVCVYHDIGDHRGNKFTAKDMRAVIRNQEWYYPGLPNSIFKFNVLLTTFETILSDFEDFEPIHWRMVVVDEAHRLKNAGSRVLKQMRVMHCDRKLLLTGTPLQNNTQELWVLLNYLEPVKFASMDEFNVKFGKLQSQEQVVELQKLLAPYLLRRVKEDVEKSIPPKEETIISVELTTLQKQYYRAIYDKNKSFLYRGAKNSLPTLNNIQLQLRKCCNHPFLIKGVEERELEELGDNPNPAAVTEKTVQCSGKMVLVSKLLPKLKREGHKVLIFSQFLKQLDLLERYCEANNFGFERLDGTTSGGVRQNAIDRFSRPNSKTCVFLLSTKAGGVGINLIAADTVIIFDSDWNPQNDLQAQARCHRIGQKKSVQIYRLVTRNTYESEMFDRASRKLGLEQAVLGTATFNEAAEQMEKPSAEQLVELLKRGAYALMEDDDKASKQFVERDIETILKENARIRVVGPAGEQVEGENGEDGASQVKHKSPQKSRKRKSLGGIAFDRSSFVADGSSDLSVDDPNFWEKVMPGAMSVEMLSAKLEDGSVLASRQSKIKFISNLDISLGELVNDLRNVNDGDDGGGVSARSSLNVEHEYGIAMQVLHRITTKHKDEFSNDQVDVVKSYLGKLEKSRVRSCRVTPAKREPAFIEETPVKKKGGKHASNSGGGSQVLSAEEIEISSDDDDDDDSARGGKRARNSRKKKLSGIPQRAISTLNPSKKRKTFSALVVDNGTSMFPSGAINDSDDLCTLCGDGGLILLCDGPCHRSFHLDCIGMDTEPDDEQWLCPDCSAGRHMCLICKQVGEMGTEFGVVQCSVAKCGRFYHRNCLTTHPRVEWVGAKRFRCPSHYCHGCPQAAQLKQAAAAAKTANKTKKAAKVDPVIGCIHCAHSLHPRCIKATDQYIRLSPSLMICANHLRPKKASKQDHEDVQPLKASAMNEPPASAKKAKKEVAFPKFEEKKVSLSSKKLKVRRQEDDDGEVEVEVASAKKKAKVVVAPVVKMCALCRRGDELKKGGTLPVEGAFIEAPVRIDHNDKTSEMAYVHMNCALHSPEVFVKPDGTFCNLARAIKRGRQLACSRCKERGATVGCVLEKCRCNYHLRCAIASKGEFIGSPYSLYCKDHAIEKRDEPTSVCVCGTQDDGDASLPLQCGSCAMKFHAKCVNMSERQALRKSKEKNWLCTSCSGEAIKPVVAPVKAAAAAVTTPKPLPPMPERTSSRSRASPSAPIIRDRKEPTKKPETKKPMMKQSKAKEPEKSERETDEPSSRQQNEEDPVEADNDDTQETPAGVEGTEEDEPEREQRVDRPMRDRASISPPRPVRKPGRKRSRKPVATKKTVALPLLTSSLGHADDVDSDHDAFVPWFLSSFSVGDALEDESLLWHGFAELRHTESHAVRRTNKQDANMERIYSAFFTSDRRRSDVELTAEALAKHNEETRQRLLNESSNHARALSPERTNGTTGTNKTNKTNEYEANRNRMTDILDPPRPSDQSCTNSAVVVVGDDLSVLDVERTVGNPTDPKADNENGDDDARLAVHRRELGQLVQQQYAIRGDVIAAARAAARAFLMAYGAKAFTALLLASRKWGGSEYGGYADAVRLLLRVDTIRFGAFFGSLVGVFRLTELASRLARGGRRDATNLAIAGGVSGLALLVDSEDRRSTIALYVFVRMLDVVGRHLTAIGAIPSWEYSSECLFAASNVAIMYAFLVDPTLLPKSYYNWILQIGGVTHHGLDYVVRQGWRGETDAQGNTIGFRGCQPHYHAESCVTHSMKEWVGGLGRAIQLYLPVHFLPAIIFKFPRLQKAPVSTTARITYAALCSSAFLTSYQTIVKLVVCMMRNTFQHDYVFESCFGGICSGASLFFEDPKRRFELMLYCVPRAIDIMWQLLKRRGFVRYVKHAEVALFCLSMSLIMSRPPEHFKPTYLSILRFLFGRNTI